MGRFASRLWRWLFIRCGECGRPFGWAEITVSVEGYPHRFHQTCFAERVRPRIELELIGGQEGLNG